MAKLVHDNMEKVQVSQKKATVSIHPGQELLLFLPTSNSTFSDQWQDHFKVLRQMAPAVSEIRNTAT